MHEFGLLIIRKIIEIIASRCHISRLKCKYFSGVCPFVRSCHSSSKRRTDRMSVRPSVS